MLPNFIRDFTQITYIQNLELSKFESGHILCYSAYSVKSLNTSGFTFPQIIE